MLPTRIQPENPAQIGILAMAPIVTMAFKLVSALALSYLFNPPVVEAKERRGEASKEGVDSKLQKSKSLEKRYQRLVKNIAKSPQDQRRLAGQFVDDVFGGLKFSSKNQNGYGEQAYNGIKNDLIGILIGDQVDVPNLIISLYGGQKHKEIKNIAFLINKKGIIPDVLNKKYASGIFSTHLCFNQNFNLITILLENLEGVRKNNVSEMLQKTDYGLFNATILDATSLMGSVTTPEFLNVVTKLYSQLALESQSSLKIKKFNLMLPSENFQEIFTEDYFKSLSPKELEKLSKLASRSFPIDDLDKAIKELMNKYELNPNTIYKKEGYQDTTLNIEGYEGMFETIKKGGHINIKGEKKQNFLDFLVEKIGREEALKIMEDEKKVTYIHSCKEGSIAISAGQNISSFVAEQFMKNLEYIQSNLDKIKESKASPDTSIKGGGLDPLTPKFGKEL
jgi:hypothetical protein